MKQLSYVNVRLGTTDAVARALMDYARALAVRSSSDIVDIPVVDAAGEPRAAELLIGPSSDLLCLEIDGDELELPAAAESVDELRRRERTLLPPLHDVVDAFTVHPV